MNIEKALKFVLVILFLIILFLFALNGRYEVYRGTIVFDKWTNERTVRV